MPHSDDQLVRRIPTVDEYLHLRDIAGLSPFTAEAARIGLAGSIFGTVIEHDGQAIGMGRIIGDGGCFFQVTDIAVDPNHQGRGLGKMIMSALMKYVQTALPGSAYVSLIADLPADRLYAQYGFQDVAPGSVGMAFRRN
ncbi:MAG: GNAT family N-acetyltransferase [Paracoccus sp. (in: a-proteobacteria)]